MHRCPGDYDRPRAEWGVPDRGELAGYEPDDVKQRVNSYEPDYAYAPRSTRQTAADAAAQSAAAARLAVRGSAGMCILSGVVYYRKSRSTVLETVP